MERDELRAELSLLKARMKSESIKKDAFEEVGQSSKKEKKKFESEYNRPSTTQTQGVFDSLEAVVQGIMSAFNVKFNSLAWGFTSDALKWLLAVYIVLI